MEWGRNAALHVRRAKNGKPAAHPIRGDELRALRELQRQYPDSGFVFTTEREGPFTPMRSILGEAPRRTRRFPLPIHVHMLRHACGYKLANDGHDTRQ